MVPTSAVMLSSVGANVKVLITAPFLLQMEQLQRKPPSMAGPEN
jgi:hypothetical protein